MWSIRVSMGEASREGDSVLLGMVTNIAAVICGGPAMPAETPSSHAVIVAGARTPIGRLLGSLKSFSAVDLGGLAIKAALDRAGLRGDQVDYVIMGQVLQAGAGQIPSRQAAVQAGIPMGVPSLTINKVCLSGLDAIALAGQLIRAGEFEVVVAGGMESMTQAPHLLPNSRTGHKYGSIEVIDAMAHDGLTDPFDHVSMGESTDRYNARLGISRAEQDEYSARSHQRAADAIKNGRFDDEIVPVDVPPGAAGRSHGGETQRRGEPLVVKEDEGVRPDTTAEALSRLRPAFGADGTITAGSASQISDGAAAVVVMSRAKAAALGLPVLAEIGAHGNVAGPDNSLQSQPANAIKHALGKAGLDVGALDLIEINEAFASVAVQSMRDLGIGQDKVNVDGGAIALGHPIGMSGARIALHLAYELRRRGGGLGAAALCGGGGQGDALILRVP
jgi:acetyl-CoA C-acetyltransferase